MEISSFRTPFPNYTEELHSYIDICQDSEEEFIKEIPIEYINIYAICWQSESVPRHLIDQILLQLQFMSLKPIFEDSNWFISAGNNDNGYY
jgi:hypothetical protein